MHIHNISLSFDDLSAVSSDIKIKQNDGMAHKLNISGLDFSDADRAVIKFLRSDGVTVCDEITYNDNAAEYTLCPAALAASGTVKAEISLYSGDMRITSCNFVFDVIPDINVDFALTDTDTFPVFDSVLKDMKTYVKKENGKALSTNDFTDAAKEAVDELGYSIDPNTNLPSYNSNSIWSVKKFKAEDSVTGGLQVGTYLMLHTKNGLRDVVYGSTNLQAELDGKVGFTDYATVDKAGVVKADSIKGIKVDESGEIGLNVPNETAIAQRLPANSNLPITIGNLDYAVRSVRPTTSNSIPDTLAVNTIYWLSERETLTLKLPGCSTFGANGNFIQVDFYSGKTPTNLTVTFSGGSLSDIDLIPEANTMYSLYFDWGLVYCHTTEAGAVLQEPGWRFSYAAYPHEEV